MALAWGTGHRTVGRAVAERLPSPWKEKLTGDVLNQFLADNAYPDNTAPPELERWGEKYLRLLKERGITSHFAFHDAPKRAVAFELLVRAIREKDDARTFLLLGILAHSIADQTACNHDPVVHLATYAWGAEGMGVAPQMILDAGWLAEQDRTWTIYEAELAKHSMADNGATAEEIFLRLMGYEWEGTEGIRLGRGILEAAGEYAETQNPAAERKLAEGLSYLAAWGVERTVKTFLAAVRLAESGEKVEFAPEAIREKYAEFVADYQTNRPITWDACVVPYLSEALEVAVLHDSTGRFNEGFFSSLDRILTCLVTATLREKYDAGIVDMRDFNRHGLDATKTKQVVVLAARYGNYGILKTEDFLTKLVAFQKAGGKILWIGCVPPKEITGGPLTGLRTNPEKPGYCKPVYPVPMDVLMASRVTLVETEQSWPFVRKPNGRAGWIWYGGASYFQGELPPGLKPLVTLDSPDGKRVVGVSAATWAWLPTYAVFPYVLTNEKPKLYPFDGKLDSAGREILEGKGGGGSLRKIWNLGG